MRVKIKQGCKLFLFCLCCHRQTLKWISEVLNQSLLDLFIDVMGEEIIQVKLMQSMWKSTLKKIMLKREHAHNASSVRVFAESVNFLFSN